MTDTTNIVLTILGSVNLASTLTLVFYVGRFVGRTDEAISNLKKDVEKK